MAETYFPGDITVQGTLNVQGTKQPYDRADFVATIESYALHFGLWRVWDAFQTLLPSPAAADDLGIYAGAYATGNPYIAAGDVKATSSTRYARYVFQLPPEYVSHATVILRMHAGMVTTVADGSCVLDTQVFKMAGTTLISGSDLCTTSPTTMNSTTFADIDFAISAGTLDPGDWLDIRIAIAYVDTSTVTAVIPAIGLPQIMLSVKG